MNLKKLLSHENCLNNLFLNLLGFQMVRYLASKFLIWIKYNFFSLEKNKEFNKVLQREYDLKKSFLKRYEFEKLKDEFLLAISNAKDESQSASYEDRNNDGLEYKTLYLDEKIKDKFPTLYNFKKNLFIKSYFETCEQKKKFPLVLQT